MTIEIKFEPHDIWIGAYWTRTERGPYARRQYRIFICFLPLLPIVITFTRQQIPPTDL